MSPRHHAPARPARSRSSGAGLIAVRRTLVHRFDHGEPELLSAGHYPPAVRLLLLVGGAGSLWWSLYVLVRLTLG